MRSSGLEIPFGLAISAIIFTSALSWGRPFTANGPDPANGTDASFVHAQYRPAQPQVQPAQPPQDQSTESSTYTGTITQVGEKFVLNESSGLSYRLDDARRAKRFAGKSVQVTGELDAEARVIHVESIEASRA